MKVEIRHKDKLVAKNVEVADDFMARLLGYMFRASPHEEGLLFDPAPSIHTFFMRFPLDVIFLTKEKQVLKIIRHMKPWRHTWFYSRAKFALELPAGHFPPDIREGDTLEVRNV